MNNMPLYHIHIGKPPRAIRKAKLDNIALVPASLLSRKGKYQTIANNLPGQGVLICETEKKERMSHILEYVAAFFPAERPFCEDASLFAYDLGVGKSIKALHINAYFSNSPDILRGRQPARY